MNRYILLLLLIIVGLDAQAQCLTNSIVVNTGYNPITGIAVTPGVDGATPVPDPKWTISYVSPGVYAAAGALTVVPIGSPADVITRWSGWAVNPVGNPGGYLGCLNSGVYTTDGTGPTGTLYSAVFSRPFKMCMADSVKLDLYIANDNYIESTDIDGVPLTFAQPAGSTTTFYSTFTHFTQTVYLSAGTHTFNVLQHNYNVIGAVPNPTGLDIYGTFSSATSTSSIVTENSLSCATYACATTCSNTISLADSVHPCMGDVITLTAAVVGPDSILDYTWSPATGLSSTTILSPTLTVGATSSYYYFTARSLIPFNLVANGDFSAGNTGFTSSYTYTPGPSSILLEGYYSVYDNPFGVHSGFTSFGDHTTGTGKMLIVNGSPTPSDVWCQTIPVNPNTDYDFSAWFANCSSVTGGPTAPQLQFKINGVLIGVPTTITSLPGVWTSFHSTWNSGVSTTATICIYDLNTLAGGNDFVIDDISFKEVCVARDSIFIDVKIPDTTTTRKDTILCVSASPITLRATAGYLSYLWSNGSTGTSISAFASGTYWVRNINACSIKIDTFRVDYRPTLTVDLGNDTAFCVGNTLMLSSVQPSGTTYLWNDGSTGASIVASVTGTYWLQVDNGYCYAADTIHVTISPHPLVDLGPDTFNCTGTAITLQSSVTYTSPAYLWSEGSTTSSITVPLSGSYSLEVTVAGCASADTINVTIIYDTFTLYNPDTAICRADGAFVQVRLTANPLVSFQWLPTTGIATPNVATPKIYADTSAMYSVTISLPGCPDLKDSFYIDVQPTPSVFLDKNNKVCEFDTLHLHAKVTPAWYEHYRFNWSPGSYFIDSTQSSVIFKATDSVRVYVNVTTPAGCPGMDSALIIVYPGNFARLDTSFDLCPHQSVQLTPTGGVSYRWSPSLYLDDSLSSAPWVNAITSQAYTAIATSDHGCRDTLSTRVVIHPAGHIFLGDSVTIYPGESYQIKAQTNCSHFTWYPPAGLDNPNVSDPVATPGISTRYVVKASTEWGCQATDTISVYYDISSVIAVPNAFSPGSGGINSKLYLLKRGEAELNYFRIFNRWGNMVFETKDINEGWDGTYKGKPQPLGVFVYEIEAVTNTGAAFKKHGNVTLLR